MAGVKNFKVAMTIEKLGELSENIARDICDGFLASDSFIEITYPEVESNQEVFKHRGLYAFVLSRDSKSWIVYVGKSEGDVRLRQHLTGKNKNGSALAGSVRTKHSNIKNAIAEGYTVYLSLKFDTSFSKSTLSCIEIECILQSKARIELINGATSWNTRVG